MANMTPIPSGFNFQLPQQGAVPIPQPRYQPPAQMRQGFGNQFNNFLQQNPAMVWQLAAGLMGGRNALPGAMAGMPQAMQMDQGRRTDAKQREALQRYFDGQTAMEPATKDLLSSMDPKAVAGAVLAQQYQKPGESSYFGTPLPIENDEGFAGYGLPSKSGGFSTLDPGQGNRFVSPYDLASQKSGGQTTGAAQGKAQADLPGMEYQAQKLLYDIDQALTAPGRESVTGGIQGRLPEWMFGSEGRLARSRINKLSADSFMLAYESLKGAGQITEFESASATRALNRLADTQLSDADYEVALKEFRTEVEKLLELARRKAAGGQAAPPTVAQPADPLGIR